MKLAPGGLHGSGDSECAVLLEVCLPLFLRRRLILDRGELFRAPFVIPPEYISVSA